MTKYYFNARSMPSMRYPLFSPNVFDRTRILFDVKNLEPLMPIGKADCTKKLNDICDERSFEIFKKAGAKKIYVFWSGGIDSTTALVSLLRCGAGKSLCVLMNSESVAEYPDFYDKYIKNNLNVIWVDYKNSFGIPESPDKYLQDGVLVTGEIGDQIFGSDKYLSFGDTSKLLSNWKDGMPMIEKYEEFALASPVQIKTKKDFWWWFNYAVKYNQVAFRVLRNSKTFILEENTFHFFNSVSFNDWAVSTPSEEKFFGTDIRKYKKPLKDYIYNFTKDSNYQLNKIKVGSLSSVTVNLNPFSKLNEWAAITTDGNFEW